MHSMSMDEADSTFAGVKVYRRIIIFSIIQNDILAAKRPVSYMTDVVFFLSCHVVTEKRRSRFAYCVIKYMYEPIDIRGKSIIKYTASNH